MQLGGEGWGIQTLLFYTFNSLEKIGLDGVESTQLS